MKGQHRAPLEFDGQWQHRWGVILAGGDGKRLLPLTRRITGDERPKQFCAVMGQKTLLEQTIDRVGRVIPPEQTAIVLTKGHERFYSNLAAECEPQMLVQPCNRGTAPAITYSLLRLHTLDPHGVVAIFPSDHHFADEMGFVAAADVSFEAVKHLPDHVVLLGITPDYPEPAYGWIEPGAPLGDPLPNSVYQVARFWEKPSRTLATVLMKDGCLWNSFVMIGKIAAFLAVIRQALPNLVRAFESIQPSFFTGREDASLRQLYSSIPSTGFSEEVLSTHPCGLAMVCSKNLGWSDLGETSRVLSVLKSKGVEPEWAWDSSLAAQGG